jgi:hypothetical protein
MKELTTGDGDFKVAEIKEKEGWEHEKEMMRDL